MEVILFLAVCGYNEVEKRLIRSRRSTLFTINLLPLCCASLLQASYDARLTSSQDLARQRENTQGLG